MHKGGANTCIALGAALAATFAAPAAFAGDAYDFQQWAAPGNCATLRATPPEKRTLIDQADPQDISDRLVDLLLSLRGTPTDLQPLRLPEICHRLPLNLFELPMPPPRAEPWNPNPPPVRAVQVSAMNGTAEQPFSQHLEVTYYPAAVYMRYSVEKRRAPGEERPYGSQPLYEDVGAQCPLRAAELRQRLLRAGYAQKMYGQTPPTDEFAFTDNGPSYQFTRGDRGIRVHMQGDYAEQRRDPASKCVALIEVSIEPGQQDR